jgi:formylglycine-generating enzyme required for sulfatase activity
MGAADSEKDRLENEQQHPVRITKPFYLGAYEVTQGEFAAIIGRNPSLFSNGGGSVETATGVDTSRYPVDSVNWNDGIEFCNKLSEREGRRPFYRLNVVERWGNGGIKTATVTIEGGAGYRFPTEAEWEFACRAGMTSPFSFGSIATTAECNCNDKGAYPDDTIERGAAFGSTAPVGLYRPNAFGLFDMHGNVLEWCWDRYDKDYYAKSPPSDPMGPTAGSERTNRGGSWGSYPAHCRTAIRGYNLPDFASDSLGFRVARGLEP